MRIETILENPQTGETRLVKGIVSFTPPWRVKEVKKTGTAVMEAKAKVAVLAEKWGLPVATFLDGARWLLQKDCPFCQLGTQVLRAVEELGEERAQAVVVEILAAKEAGDTERLERIRKELWPSEVQTSSQA